MNGQWPQRQFIDTVTPGAFTPIPSSDSRFRKAAERTVALINAGVSASLPFEPNCTGTWQSGDWSAIPTRFIQEGIANVNRELVLCLHPHRNIRNYSMNAIAISFATLRARFLPANVNPIGRHIVEQLEKGRQAD